MSTRDMPAQTLDERSGEAVLEKNLPNDRGLLEDPLQGISGFSKRELIQELLCSEQSSRLLRLIDRSLPEPDMCTWFKSLSDSGEVSEEFLEEALFNVTRTVGRPNLSHPIIDLCRLLYGPEVPESDYPFRLLLMKDIAKELVNEGEDDLAVFGIATLDLSPEEAGIFEQVFKVDAVFQRGIETIGLAWRPKIEAYKALYGGKLAFGLVPTARGVIYADSGGVVEFINSPTFDTSLLGGHIPDPARCYEALGYFLRAHNPRESNPDYWEMALFQRPFPVAVRELRILWDQILLCPTGPEGLTTLMTLLMSKLSTERQLASAKFGAALCKERGLSPDALYEEFIATLGDSEIGTTPSRPLAGPEPGVSMGYIPKAPAGAAMAPTASSSSSQVTVSSLSSSPEYILERSKSDHSPTPFDVAEDLTEVRILRFGGPQGKGPPGRLGPPTGGRGPTQSWRPPLPDLPKPLQRNEFRPFAGSTDIEIQWKKRRGR